MILRRFLFPLLAFLPIIAASQDADSLQKYSYPIFLCHNGITKDNGSGFLYKIGKRMFLISNYHVLKAWNPVDGTPKKNPIDSIFLKIPEKNTKDSINISLLIPGGIEKFYWENRPDLHYVEIHDDPRADFHFINELIDNSVFSKAPNEVYIYGFPAKYRNIPFVFASKISMLKGEYLDHSYAHDSIINASPGVNELRPDYSKKFNRLFYYVKDSTLSKDFIGMSGSPAFGKFTILKKGKSYTIFKFMGVFCGGNERIKQLFIIRPDVVDAYLKQIPAD